MRLKYWPLFKIYLILGCCTKAHQPTGDLGRTIAEKCFNFFIPWGGGGEETEMADIVHVVQFILVSATVQLSAAPKNLHSFVQDCQLGSCAQQIPQSGFWMGLSIILSLSRKMSSDFKFLINDWWRVFSPSPDQLGKYLCVGIHE